MILSIPIDQFEFKNICFLDSKKNMNMNGIFTKINYHINGLQLNGIYITYSLQRFKAENTIILQKLHRFELEIVEIYKRAQNIQKPVLFSLLPYLMAQSKNMELCDENTWFSNAQTNIVKISGIWEDENSVGINYRIIHT
jgi:hypothetical protein